MSALLLFSPVGPLLVGYDAEAVRVVRFWPQGEHPPAATRDAPARGDRIGSQIAAEFREYFAGERRAFTVPLAPEGTSFQRRVWAALGAIPFGETRSYRDIAAEAGSPGGAIAVGQANARNPIPIVVPCHRVLAADGGIGGYMGAGSKGSGIGIKQWLLRHEGIAGW